MRSRVLLAVVTILAVALPAVAAPGDRIVAARDARNDVRLVGDGGGLTPVQRRSIDLRLVTVDDAPGGVRFTSRLPRITTSKKFHQMVFVRLLPAAGSEEEWSGNVGFSPQLRELGFAYLNHPDGSFEGCDPLRAKVQPRRHQVSLRVPNRCLPTEEARIRVITLTGFFRSDGDAHSRDRLVVSGKHRLR
jgi:hypothetical protein